MRLLILLLVPFLLVACSKSDTQSEMQKTADSADVMVEPGTAERHPNIDKDALMKHIEVLSSDKFGGRAPASPGEELTVNYLRDQFRALGAQPGNGSSYFQDVPLVTMTGTPTGPLKILGSNEQSFSLEFGKDMVIWTKRVTEASAIDQSELVFVGYGIVAPEYNWNDYADINVKGKTVVILVNDPGYATQDPDLFNGNAMTYYGRWTYKFEEAAKQGAAGALVIHETAPAAYPWSVVEGSWTGPQHDLVTPDKNMSRAAIEGWITDAQADLLFKASGSSYEQVKKEALDRGTASRSMSLNASVGLTNSISVSDSKNVLAKIEGSERPDEYVLYMGHWDHLGTDPNLEGDKIYNGAVDNATGTAGLMELARAFATLEQAPKRSIMFVAVTAEESGLLGSKHFAENPPVPLNKIVAGINMDALNVYGATRDVAVVGYGASELERYLAAAASKQQRNIGPEPTPEKGFFYRSDHFNLAKKGVPMLYAKGGNDLIDGGTAEGEKRRNNYVANNYHKPSDEINEHWDITGTAEDLQLYFNVGRQISSESNFPNWYDGNEFKAIRDASLAQ